jgi:hypothetical protein
MDEWHQLISPTPDLSRSQKKIVTHFVLVSLFPNWIGQKQQRLAKVEGDSLQLSTASPIQSGGQSVNAYLQWRRAHWRRAHKT